MNNTRNLEIEGPGDYLKFIVSTVIGYLFGCINPAVWIGKRKQINLREKGTCNPGATNVTLNLGAGYGVLVLLLDMAKSFAASKLAVFFFPGSKLAGLTAGCGAVIGHIYPVFMRFKGGKGLAALGGLILAADPAAFACLLMIGMLSVLFSGYAAALPISAITLTPAVLAYRSRSLYVLLLLTVISGIMFWKHRENIRRIRNGEEDTWQKLLIQRND